MANESDNIAVATRLPITALAKAYELLVNRGVSLDKISNISQIIRLTVFVAIIDNFNTADSSPSEESIQAITRIINKSKK